MDGQDVEDVKHFPPEQNDRNANDQNREYFAEREAAFLLEATRAQAENVECGETENQRPEQVVDIFAG